jgi:hypothetical protein
MMLISPPVPSACEDVRGSGAAAAKPLLTAGAAALGRGDRVRTIGPDAAAAAGGGSTAEEGEFSLTGTCTMLGADPRASGGGASAGVGAGVVTIALLTALPADGVW